MNIQTRLDPEILEAAKKAAGEEGVTLSEYLRKLLMKDVDARTSTGSEGEGAENQGGEIR